MRKALKEMSRVDQITWAVTAICVAALGLMLAMTGMIDLGAAAHDAFCQDHGWAV